MADLTPNDVLSLDKKSYQEHFSNSDFGVMLATQLVKDLGFSEPLVRKTEGSSLVFSLGPDYFLKITPPFFGDSIEAEITATKIIGDQLPFPIPKIVRRGKIKDWDYLVSSTVPGRQAKEVLKTFTPENKLVFASDIGLVIKAFNRIDSAGFERNFGPWKSYLTHQLTNQRSIHLERGNSHDWAEKIGKFIQLYAPALLELSPAKLIHADLNHEHLLLQKTNDLWRVSGVLDLADAMNAPIELEFVLPMICFFKGRRDLQQILLEASDYKPNYKLNDYPNVMMAMALQNRFIAFHDWFGREIKEGADSIEEIAAKIFPAL
jgi:Phosphotransferase enzyme family